MPPRSAVPVKADYHRLPSLLHKYGTSNHQKGVLKPSSGHQHSQRNHVQSVHGTCLSIYAQVLMKSMLATRTQQACNYSNLTATYANLPAPTEIKSDYWRVNQWLAGPHVLVCMTCMPIHPDPPDQLSIQPVHTAPGACPQCMPTLPKVSISAACAELHAAAGR
jgi:hypothetical protein